MAGMTVGSRILLEAAITLISRSVVSRNGTELWRHAIAQLKHDFVDVAPAPPFRWIIAFDDGVAGLVKVLGGMSIG